MPLHKSAADVAKRAIILSVMDLRSSCEAFKENPKAKGRCAELLPWLRKIQVTKQLHPIERKELETPLGKLSSSEMIDINWAGESAYFLCWALRLVEEFSYQELSPIHQLPELLQPLQLDAEGFIKAATLRHEDEIEASCRRIALIRSVLAEKRLDASASKLFRQLNIKRLEEECQLVATDQDIDFAKSQTKGMAGKKLGHMTGKISILCNTSTWLVSKRRSFWIH